MSGVILCIMKRAGAVESFYFSQALYFIYNDYMYIGSNVYYLDIKNHNLKILPLFSTFRFFLKSIRTYSKYKICNV